MKDKDKTKEQLVNELEKMRQRVAESEEASEVGHKRVGEDSQESEGDYHKLFELLPIGVTMLDMKGVVLYCNSAVYSKGGYTKGSFTGKHFSKIASVRVKDIPTYIRIFNTIVRGKIPKPFEAIYQRKDGTSGWTEISISLIKVGGKRCILVMQHDITERKQVEEELNKFKTITDGANYGIAMINTEEGTFIYTNNTFNKMHGYTTNELIGSHFSTVFTKEQLEEAVNLREHLLSTGEQKTVELWRKKKDGTVFPTMTRSIVVKDDKGKSLFLTASVIDITEPKQAEEKETRLQQELNLTSHLASVGQMAAGIAHEINNPLTGVIGFSDLLMKKDIPEDIRKDVNIIYDGAQRVANIVSRMLTYARHSKPERISINVNELVETTLALRAYEMETSNIKVTTQLDPDLPMTMADAGQLQQVFLNIMMNAETEMIQAHGGGNLAVETEKLDNTLRITFKDDGPGIIKKNLERIFEPFFSTREVGQGAGLGLGVCYGIITQHGGKIYAKSKSGKGATFIVELPITTKAEQLKFVESVAEPSGVSRAKILVVEDEPMVQRLLTEILSQEGHESAITDNGEDAMARLGSEDYDVILLDIKLPGISGIELYKQLQKKAKPSARRVIFITGDTMSRDTMAFLSKTRAPYVTKPFNAEQLIKDINGILAQSA